MNAAHGRYLHPDADGNLHSDVDTARIPAETRAVARAVFASAAAEASVGFVSGYLRGSFARGLGIVGESDVDLVAVVEGADPASDGRAQRHWLSGLAGTFSEHRLDVEVVPHLPTLPGGGHVPRMLGLEGVLIAGRPYHGASRIVPFDDRLVYNLRVVDERATVVRGSHPLSTALWRWFAKCLVRALFESVMLEYGAYTRDLVPCAVAVSHLMPAHGQLTWEIAASAVQDERAPADLVARSLAVADWLSRLRQETSLAAIRETAAMRKRL